MQSLVGKATALAKGPLHIIRGSGEQEKLLKNAKTQFTAENEEISTYLALEVFATKVGDTETAKLARDIRKEEERMAKFLETQIRQLAAATALEEVPAGQRRGTPEKRRGTKKRAAAKPKKAAASKPKKASSEIEKSDGEKIDAQNSREIVDEKIDGQKKRRQKAKS